MNQIRQELERVQNHISLTKRNDISIKKIEEQLNLFQIGVKVPLLVKPCTIDDGIVTIRKAEHDDLLKNFNLASKQNRIIKFVPASGAASRMFHKLHSAFNHIKDLSLSEIKNKSHSDKNFKYVLEFLLNLKKFAFYTDLKIILNVDDSGIEKLINNSPYKILEVILTEQGLNYSSKPKGAVKFHLYNEESRTAFEEQIYEALNLFRDNKNSIKIHFTISEEHTDLFLDIINNFKINFTETNLDFEITYSHQKNSTNTIAVDAENKIIFDKSGNLIHRPGGHGALLENLNDLKADIVIIKNIDNLSVENLSEDAIFYKKLLVGYLIKAQNKIFEFLTLLDKKLFDEKVLNEIFEFAESKLFINSPEDFKSWDAEKKYNFLFNRLNRPIRVCGMVKNEGEPGGGPFWVKAEDGSLTLQIVEQAQIDVDDEKQQIIFKQSTHFNPVDLICGLRNFKGDNFDLHKFVDYQSGIISKKFKDGIELKALELPGLWNGSMADWITIFVDVPSSTFNPVKEVNDLLKKAHQN
ncbi:MAG TPA: DUF4301 domain-containing protein [Ignavibacteriales bacterium]|nr:DUF4301 domain-containing protein [Ignavibacteriales bacterium]